MKIHAALAGLLLAATACGDDWPGWRGPKGDGVSMAMDPPLKWSRTENVRWKAPLPDVGNASPVVWGDAVFVAQAVEKGAKRGLICLDRATGKQRWFRHVPFAGKEPTHDTNPYGSATPVTDGERVIVSLGSAGLVCWDFEGEQLWRRDLGKFIHIWGNASSPVLYGDLCILWCGPGERQFLIAVDKRTGKDVWKHEEPGGKAGLTGGGENWLGSWSTPLVTKVGGRDELILGVPKRMKGFDPTTGKELWSCAGMGPLVYTSPAISAERIVLGLSGYGGPALAVKAGGSEDVTEHRLWRQTERNPQRIGSPVVVSGRAYVVNEPGLMSCFDLKTGKDLWDRKRIAGQTWASPVFAAGRLYVTDMAGTTWVVRSGPQPEVLARNPLGERVLASPAILDDGIYIRTYQHLWCVGNPKA